MPYLPYAKDHTQIQLKNTLIEAIKKSEGNNEIEYFPYLDLQSENEEKATNMKSLLAKFYDEEQNITSNGGKLKIT